MGMKETSGSSECPQYTHENIIRLPVVIWGSLVESTGAELCTYQQQKWDAGLGIAEEGCWAETRSSVSRQPSEEG